MECDNILHWAKQLCSTIWYTWGSAVWRESECMYFCINFTWMTNELWRMNGRAATAVTAEKKLLLRRRKITILACIRLSIEFDAKRKFFSLTSPFHKLIFSAHLPLSLSRPVSNKNIYNIFVSNFVISHRQQQEKLQKLWQKQQQQQNKSAKTLKAFICVYEMQNENKWKC